MRDYGKKTNQDIENTEDENSFESMSDDKRKEFHHLWCEIVDSKLRKFDKESEDIEIAPASKRHKIRMNRLFRECVGDVFLPFPEVDSVYERIRSKIIVKLKINEFLNRPKNRKCEKRHE